MHQILFVVLAVTQGLGAEELEFGSISASPPKISEMARSATFRHGRIRSGSQCERILDEAVGDLGRDFTLEEIERNLPDLLKATGESLEPVKSKSNSFFGRGMGVAF